uniref:RRM domain-containing protein n=1 Tax=Alexandrium monilatum TaxID=311494 RepID=A0A7S4QU65_9DINO
MAEAPSDTLWVGDLPPNIDEETIKTVFGAYGNVSRVKVLPVSNSKGASIVQFTNVQDAAWIVDNVNGNIAQGLPAPVVVKFAKPSGSGRGGWKGGPAAPALGPASGKGGATPAQTAATIAAAAIAAASAQASGRRPASAAGQPVGAGGSWRQGDAGHWESQPYNGKGAGKGGTRMHMEELLEGFVKGGVFPPVERNRIVQLYVSGLPTDTTDLDLYKLFSPFGCPVRPNGIKAMTKPDGTCTGVGFVDVCDPGAAQAAMNALHGMVLPDGSHLRVQPKRNQGKGA